MEQLETSLNCAHVLTWHAKLEVFDKESDFMSTIDSIFVLRSSVSADCANTFLHTITFIVTFAIFEVLFLVVLLSVSVLDLIIVVFLIKEVLLLLLFFFILEVIVIVVIDMLLMVLFLPLAFFGGAELAIFGCSELILFVDHGACSFLVMMVSLLLVPSRSIIVIHHHLLLTLTVKALTWVTIGYNYFFGSYPNTALQSQVLVGCAKFILSWIVVLCGNLILHISLIELWIVLISVFVITFLKTFLDNLIVLEIALSLLLPFDWLRFRTYFATFRDHIGWVAVDSDWKAKDSCDHSFQIDDSDECKVWVNPR